MYFGNKRRQDDGSHTALAKPKQICLLFWKSRALCPKSVSPWCASLSPETQNVSGHHSHGPESSISSCRDVASSAPQLLCRAWLSSSLTAAKLRAAERDGQMKAGVVSSLQNICICPKSLQQVPDQAGEPLAAASWGSVQPPPDAPCTRMLIPPQRSHISMGEGEKASARLSSPKKGDFIRKGCFTGRHQGNFQWDNTQPSCLSFPGLSLHVSASQPQLKCYDNIVVLLLRLL